MSNDQITDAEHEASECLRRAVDIEKKMDAIKEEIKERTKEMREDLADLKATHKSLLASAKRLAKEGAQTIAKGLTDGQN
jgi:predicted  nucleic acid-binding Zn-ribbon protein